VEGFVLKHLRISLAAFAFAGMCTWGAFAAAPVKIGLVTTLSGPAGYTGQDVRDGFNLAVEQEGGKLGGVPVDVMVEDDGFQPATGRQAVDRFLQQDGAKIITGPVFSNVMGAVAPEALSAGAFYVSPNAGSSEFAGAKCNQNLFVASFQNDTANIPAGVYANQHGYKNMVLLAEDYVAGHDMINGFLMGYKGTSTQVLPKLGQTDYSADIARIRSLNPDAVFYFLPGGDGITFLKQWSAAGMKTPLLATIFSVDERILSAVGPAANGMSLIGQYNIDFPNPENQMFVKTFEARYHHVPTLYAADGYDTAHAIGSALKAVDGDMSKMDAFRDAMRKADFKSVRPGFAFGPNQYPLENWYAMKVAQGADGNMKIVTLNKVLNHYGDPYSKLCKM
jgi:branched-chain amino acid transport system substrate-binding protein